MDAPLPDPCELPARLSRTVDDGGPRAVRLRSLFAKVLVGTVLALGLAGCTSAPSAPQPTRPVSTATGATADSGPSVAGSQVTGSVSPPLTADGGRVFATGELTFRYDRSWMPSIWSVESTTVSSIVYLSTQPTHDPCITTSVAGGGVRVDCASPVTALFRGGALIDWYYDGLPGTSLRGQPGRAVTFAGHSARLVSGPPDPRCAQIRGTRSVDAVIDPEPPNGSPSLLHMDACLTRAAKTAPVLAMLQSLRLTAPAALTSPARFPPVAIDDPCQPLRHDPDFSQPEATGPLPESSAVTAARWCVSSPGTHGLQLQRYQSTGNVSALNRALHAPLLPVGPPPTACPAGPAVFPINVEVLDQHGNLSRPSLPIDFCGAISGTLSALGATPSTPLAGD